MPLSIRRHQKKILPFCADSVEFCPHPETFSWASTSSGDDVSDVFVCGNYQLDEDTKRKHGALWVYACERTDGTANEDSPPSSKESEKDVKERQTKVEDKNDSGGDGSGSPPKCAAATPKASYRMVELGMLQTSAIFDLKWCPKKQKGGHMLLGEAAEDGFVSIYGTRSSSSSSSSGGETKESSGETSTTTETAKNKDNKPPPCISVLSRTEVVKNKKPCLSLDWSPIEPNMMVVSQGDRGVSVWSVGEKGAAMTRKHLIEKAHDIDEVWIAAFDRANPSLVYSGSDDCTLKSWDLRESLHKPVVVNSGHEAGVTVISPHPHREHVLATGSYDEKIRIFDKRNLYRPLSQYETGGGVWRLRWNSNKGQDEQLLAACMRAGFQVVSLDKDLKLHLQAKYDDHTTPGVTTLAYGCDWGRCEPSLIGSCSFYDKQLHLWSIHNEK